MASFFQSFGASLMPKQLLRYALSRLDLLDAQALDLENLDFALGRNTVLEFRDVGLVLQKLEKLLGLPPAFSLQKAKVLVLRVTVPMDFYTSPITVEVDGVDVRLKVASASKQGNDLQQTTDHGKGVDVSDVVPTAADLAQDFLETQPVAEKKELEQALAAAETQELDASVAVSETGSDDSSTIGTGQTLSLPAFLTGFLQGIVDRMQIRVQGVTFQIDVDVPIDPSAPAPELVTFQLSLDTIQVEGVTSPKDSSDDEPALVHKEGKRHVLLDNIRAVLISETNVFSSLVPSPSISSPVASRSPVATQTSAFAANELTRSFSSDSTGRGFDGFDDPSESQYPLQDSEAALNIPYDLGGDDEPDRAEEPSPLSTPRASVYQGSPPPTVAEHAKSTVMEPTRTSWFTDEREAQSEPSLRPPGDFSVPDGPFPDASVHSDSSNNSSGGAAEDLAQSHLYSHEEAESMYMSAFSHAASSKLSTGMPGAWHDSEDSSDEIGEELDAPFTTTSHSLPVESQILGAHTEHSMDQVTQQQLETHDELYPDDTRDLHEQQPAPEEFEPQQDDVATPRGPTRLVKEILSLTSVSVYLPSLHEPVEVPAPPDLGRSVAPNIPGAFSIHSSAATSPRLAPINETPTESAPVDSSIEIVLKPMEVRFDASVGFLLAMVVARLLEAAQPEPVAIKKAGSTSQKSSNPKDPNIQVTVEKLSVIFLEKLSGVADVPHRTLEKRTPSFDAEVLLQANLVNLRGSVSTDGSLTQANLSVEKMRFGYANDDIVSFDRSVQLFESVASTFPSAGQDISIKATLSPDASRIDVNTLPLHLKLDLQRLDDTFSWFGGLSSFLNMGASITSSASRASKSPAKQVQKPRGVRFDEPIHPNERTTAKESKMDLRINGLQVDVIGRDCSVVLNTSALKLVSREGLIGVHFSRIRLLGPYLKTSRADAPVIAELVDTRAEYLLLPRTKDLERLLELITPSKNKFDETGDEIMVDTLLRQRRKGSVLSLTVGKLRVDAVNLQQLSCLPSLADDLAKLGTVAKYLPEDDRPGLLTLCQVKSVECRVDVGGRLGAFKGLLTNLEVAQITVPALCAVALGTISVTRNKIEELVTTSPAPATSSSPNPPVLMMRIVDEMEPALRVNLSGLSVEYKVTTIMDILDLAEDATPQDYEASLAASVANLGDQAHGVIKAPPSGSPKPRKPIKVDVAFRDCLVGLNPLGLPSKLTTVLTDAHLEIKPGVKDNLDAALSLKKAAVLLIDDVAVLESTGAPFASTRRPQGVASPQVTELCGKGYVNICQISSAGARVKATKGEDGETKLEIGVRDDLLIIETCADSTQTLMSLAKALTPPTPPSKEIKYRTQVVPFKDLLTSLGAEAFGGAEGDYDFDNDFALARELGGGADSEDDLYNGPSESPLNLDSQYYEQEELFDATSPSMVARLAKTEDTADGVLLSTASLGGRSNSELESSGDDLSIHEDYFEQEDRVRAPADEFITKERLENSPLKVSVCDVHVIWNLFDGFDWVRTREVIAQEVREVEAKALERRAKVQRRGMYDDEFEEDDIIGDCLFNSIYIGIPANHDPAELTREINRGLQDFGDTESVATTAVTSTTVRAAGGHRRGKSLKLHRSKRHKITFELKGVNADFAVFAPGSGDLVSAFDVWVHDAEIFDHVPTSTWRKFATYDIDAGEREMGASMVHLESKTLRLVESPATEMELRATVLPLRLHVDQDALDFLKRFFMFKDESVPASTPSDTLFLRRVQINSIPVKLDYKPKRIDYAGLRGGRTTEFMNFITLEEARLVLRRVILYGIPGPEELGIRLNDLWTDDVKWNQLPTVLAGLAPLRSLANAGSGFRDLVMVPLAEYRKDGRVLRSLTKGARAFAKTTGIEVVRLGAKLAIGTQNALQGAEAVLVPGSSSAGGHAHQYAAAGAEPGNNAAAAGGGGAAAAAAADEWEDEYEEEVHRKISLYAHQPLGVVAGVRGAYASLARDLALTRDAIIAVPAEVMESGTAQGAAGAVLRKAPTIILRPAIGASKALGQTLLGATNALDPLQRRRVEAKYKA